MPNAIPEPGEKILTTHYASETTGPARFANTCTRTLGSAAPSHPCEMYCTLKMIAR